MSLLGRGIALASVGLSCQTVFQIHRAAPALEGLAGEKLDQVGMPWDWRIAGPADVAACVRGSNPYPVTASELSGDRRRYWEKRRTWFWHNKWDDFQRFTEHQAHLWANWGRIGRVDRQIFIGSNVQNNLREKQVDPGGFDRFVRLEDLFGLLAALELVFKRPELHWVTRSELVTDLNAFGFTRIREREHVVTVKRLAQGGVHLHLLEPDRTSWQGAPEGWDRILDRIVRAKAPSKVTKAK